MTRWKSNGLPIKLLWSNFRRSPFTESCGRSCTGGSCPKLENSFMLTFLSVKNLATVEQIKVEFLPGLNILTGSTGAGKSIILGSLGLVLGDKADSDIVRTEAESAIVEALFSSEGKSE